MSVAGSFTALLTMPAKQGEFTALKAVNGCHQLDRIQPLFVIDPEGKRNQRFELVGVLRHLHALGRTAMLDASDVVGRPESGGGPIAVLNELADRLSPSADLLGEDQVPFIPVLRGDAPITELRSVVSLARQLQSGGALRLQTRRVSRHRVEALLGRLELGVDQLDVLLDLGYVPEVTERLVEDALGSLTAIAECGKFRSLSLLSGSVPKTLRYTSTWQEPRAEEELWERVRDASAGEVRFGDYGVVHPVIGRGFGSRHVMLKYAGRRQWTYARERVPDEGSVDEAETEGRRARTMRDVCRGIVHSDDYAGVDYSWGDLHIKEAADGGGEKLGDSSRPIAYATSHHLAYLSDYANGEDASR